MSKVAFDQYYEQLTDEELVQILSDREDLVPKALAALDREVQRRHLRPSAPPNWTPGPDSEEGMHSLEDNYAYQRLLKEKRFMDRFWYWLALIPLILLIFPERYAYRDPQSVSSSVALIILIAGYWLFLKLRLAAYSCPECGQRFGSGDACYRCGFPKSSDRHL
jgi:hypothetical protein